MDIPVHNQMIWYACVKAKELLSEDSSAADPTHYFPWITRGSWLNDTNQATLVTDVMSASDATIRAGDEGYNALKNFLGELWQIEEDYLLGEMGKIDAEAAEKARRHQARFAAEPGSSIATSAEDLGVYIPHDHLDVEKSEPALEFDGFEGRKKRATTIHETCAMHLPTRMLEATPTDGELSDRLDPSRLTDLGSLLHTIQDFYAHSNYVELLLWSLRWRGQLDEEVAWCFNHPERLLQKPKYPMLFCPLPSSDERHLTQKHNAMWYGESPAATPLVSTLFGKEDTAYSVLKLYAGHLERIGGKKVDDDEALDLAMAIFDVPGRPIVRAAWGAFTLARDAIAMVGKAARGALASYVEGRAQTQTGDAKKALEMAAGLIRSFRSQEAREWAQAGFWRYIMHLLEMEMSKELDDQSPAQWKLPHHSLLHKDHWMPSPEYALRFRLACLLATELSTKIIANHFASQPRPAVAYLESLTDRYLIHPWDQLQDGGILQAQGLHAAIDGAFGSRWDRLHRRFAPSGGVLA